MNASIIWIIVIILLIVLFGVWYYLNVTAEPIVDTSSRGPDLDQLPGNNEMAGNTSPSIKEFTISGENFSFAPNAITVNQGDRVKIIFKNVNGTHDFKIDEFNVATNVITGGQEQSAEFTADKVGSFEYYCSVGNHRAMGMKGTLVVN